MKVILKSAEYTDFRGIKSKKIDFDPVTTTIEQPIGTGKPTLDDGFHWVIEGKNSEGKSQFKTEPDNVEDPKTKVTLTLDVDGKEVVLSKVPGKWSYDKLECNKSVFENFLSNIQSIETLGYLSSPTAFMNIHWETRRNILTKMFCEKVSEDSEFSFLMKSMSISDIRKSKTQQKKLANDGLKKCATIIEVYEKGIKEVFDIDFLSLKKELTTKTAEIEKLSNFDLTAYNKVLFKNENVKKDYGLLVHDYKRLEAEFNAIKDENYETSKGCAQCGSKVTKEVFDKNRKIRFDLAKTKLENKQNEIIEKRVPLAAAKKAFEDLDKTKPDDTTNEIIRSLKEGVRLLDVQIAKENDIAVLNGKIIEEQKRLDTFTAEIMEIEGFMDRFASFLVDNYYKSINDNFEGLFFDVEDECKLTNSEGVEFKDFSLSEKINAGVQVISVLSKKIGLQWPIWIDNRESVTDLYPIDTQVINLKVLGV